MNEDILLAGIWHLRSSSGGTVPGRGQESNLAISVSDVSHLLEQWGLSQTEMLSVPMLPPSRPSARGKST